MNAMPEHASVSGRVVLVVGASGGIGTALVDALLEAGAHEVIAASRKPSAAPHPRVKPIHMDVIRHDSVMEAARIHGSRVDWVICANGINSNHRLAHYDEAAARAEMETNYFGLINIFCAFAPAMKARGHGAIVNMLSALAHVNHPMMATYCASKAAAFSVTQAMRAELAASGVRVRAVLAPAVDTPMTAHLEQTKLAPGAFARLLIDALQGDEDDIYPAAAQALREALQRDPKAVERAFAAHLA